MNKETKIRNFNPNGPAGRNLNLFGLPFETAEAEIVVVPVPWDVTVSYRDGTANGPEAIFEASLQVDLFDPLFPDLWKAGIALDRIPGDLKRASGRMRKRAVEHIEALSRPGKESGTGATARRLAELNRQCSSMVEQVRNRCLYYLRQNKLVALLGGDHSTPLGLIQALGIHHGQFGILQIDAHADLRNAYEGFEFSHASIMFNALKEKNVTRLVQVGIRDYCEEEVAVVERSGGRVKCFYDRDLKHAQAEGETWKRTCDRIIRSLPKELYISFDIDGLDPKLCPNTGTPVPGGFEFEQVCYLFERIVKAGKTIIGFDVNEVAPGKDEWDASVGARLLYRLAGYAAYSQGRIGKAR